MVEQMT